MNSSVPFPTPVTSHCLPAAANAAAADTFVGVCHAFIIRQLFAGQRGGVSATDAFAVLVVVREIIDVAADFALIVATVGDAPPFVHCLTLAAPFTAIEAFPEALIWFRLHKFPFMPKDFTEKFHGFALLIAVVMLATVMFMALVSYQIDLHLFLGSHSYQKPRSVLSPFHVQYIHTVDYYVFGSR